MTDESTTTKKSILKKWWFWLIAIVVFIIIIANLGEKNPSSRTDNVNLNETNSENVEESPKEDIELLEWKIQKGEYGNTVIVGKVKNNTDEEYSYVQVEFNLYDEDDALVGSALANVNNMEAHGTWKFEAMCLEKNFKTAKFKGITEF